MAAITLYGTPTSGHSHRVELLLLMLELFYDFEVTPREERRTAVFTALNPLPGDLARATQIAERVLRFMDDHLKRPSFLASDRHPSIADLACYCYVAHAPEGRISLEAYANVRRWLSRIEGLPKFRPMPRLPEPAKS